MEERKKLKKSGIKRLVSVFISALLNAIIFFVAAGRVDLPRAWVYFGISFLFLLVNTIGALKFFPEIANVRGEIKKGTKSWDKVFIALYIPMLLILPVIAGLDVGRYGWSSISIYFAVVGIALFTISAIITDWAMITNAYFETTVRIQKDRSQQVVTTGPYRIVRHPGYVGIILMNMSFPLIIGSAFALIPAGIITLLFMVRTSLEDRTLQNELDGYSEYTKRTRYKLLPGVW